MKFRNNALAIVIQSALAAAGFPVGPIDGEFGPLSQSATKLAIAADPTLKPYGLRGAAVVIGQRFLNDHRGSIIAALPLLRVDGVDGPITASAASAFVAQTTVSKDKGKIVSATLPALADGFKARLVAVARGDVGKVFETSKNQGPGILHFWEATDFPETGFEKRWAYCAAGMCSWIKDAAEGLEVKFELPTTPAAFGFDPWARANPAGVKYRINIKEAAAGDIVIFEWSHIGLVIGRDGSGPGSGLITVEANTDGAGTRDGDGVYEKTRPLRGIRSIHRFI